MSLFSKKNGGSGSHHAISTLICEGCVIKGDLKAPNFVRIDGQITGDINIDAGLIVGEKGVVTGNIVTRELIIYGIVNGNIKAESLKIESSGKINGEIKTQTLQVEMGAVYNGKLSTSTPTTSTPITEIEEVVLKELKLSTL
ncbi:polymer-forming cytoskeletal protein [Mucilaginibacter sp. AW1-3]